MSNIKTVRALALLTNCHQSINQSINEYRSSCIEMWPALNTYTFCKHATSINIATVVGLIVVVAVVIAVHRANARHYTYNGLLP